MLFFGVFFFGTIICFYWTSVWLHEHVKPEMKWRWKKWLQTLTLLKLKPQHLCNAKRVENDWNKHSRGNERKDKKAHYLVKCKSKQNPIHQRVNLKQIANFQTNENLKENQYCRNKINNQNNPPVKSKTKGNRQLMKS